MHLTSRIQRLERHTPACPLCDGKGKFVLTTRCEEEPPMTPTGCDVCGRIRHIEVVWTEGSLNGRRVVNGERLTGEQLWDLHSGDRSSVLTRHE